MNADGSDQTRLTSTMDATESHPRWSPDGKRIVFVRSQYGPDAISEIYTMNADGTDTRRLTRSDVWEEEPAWSPDGQQVAFESGGIYVMNADGSNRRALVDTDDDYYEPAWSPDGSHIAFNSYREASSGDIYTQAFVVNKDGSGLVHVPDQAKEDAYYSAPRWSPDGKWLGLYATLDDAIDVYVVRPDGSGFKRVSDGGLYFEPVWSPDGSRIAFLGAKEPTEAGGNLYVANADGSDQTMIAEAVVHGRIAWAPAP